MKNRNYFEQNGELMWRKPVKNGAIPTPLANFTARIVTDITVSDGVKNDRRYEIEATVSGSTARFEIPAAQFASLNWVAEKLGAEAMLQPGFSSKDHVRAAIQELSSPISKRRRFAHIGWVKMDDQWHYLHADGAIGPVGTVGTDADTPVPITSADVSLPESLKLYKLPAPPSGEELRDAVRASLDVLTVADRRITVPLLAAVCAAVLINTDSSLYLAGPTGAGKSELAALAQQHFGKEMDARHLPASYSSTANALETEAFYAKDAVMAVDDFVPVGQSSDVSRLNADADRLLRGQGNQSGRQRLSKDSELQAGRFPRGLIVSTGEDIPVGNSLRARITVVEIGPNSVDFSKLTKLQRHAASGEFSKAQAALIAYVASEYSKIRSRVAQRARELRKEFDTVHRRTAPAIANLAASFEEYLLFATKCGAITHDEAKELFDDSMVALKLLAIDQGKHLESHEPTEKFLCSLRSAIAAGKAHVATPEGVEPPNPLPWGWTFQEIRWYPRGQTIGWLDGADLYVDPEISYRLAKELSGNGPEALSITSGTLRKRLHEKGLLKTTDHERNRLTVRRTLEGARRDVLHLAASSLIEVAQLSQLSQTEGTAVDSLEQIVIATSKVEGAGFPGTLA